MSAPHSMSRGALWALKTGIPTVMAGAGILSFDGLAQLADLVGWHGWKGFLLPVGVEVYAAISAVAWNGAPEGSETKRHAFRNLLGAVGLSMVLNSLWHLIDYGVVPMGWPVVLGLSLVPPMILAAVIHLGMTALPTEAPGGAGEAREPQPELVPEPLQSAPGTGPGAGPVPVPDILAEVPEPAVSAVHEILAESVPTVPVVEPAAKGNLESRPVQGASAFDTDVAAAVVWLKGQQVLSRDLGTVRAPELARQFEAVKSSSWWRGVLREARRQVADQLVSA